MARVRKTAHPTAASTRPKRTPRKTETTTTTTTTTTIKNPVTGKRKTTKKTSTTGAGAANGVHHQKRKPHLKDKIAGALEKAKGIVEGKPGKKAAGTKRMEGTDGRGSHHVTT